LRGGRIDPRDPIKKRDAINKMAITRIEKATLSFSGFLKTRWPAVKIKTIVKNSMGFSPPRQLFR
jgi:hypothetical protein